MFTRCKKCGRLKLLGRGWVNQYGKYWYCPDCWNDVVSQRKTRRQRTTKKVVGKSKKSEAAKTRTQARKLIKGIISVNLRQGAYEIREARLDKLVDLGPEIIPLITDAISSIYEPDAEYDYSAARELCATIGRIGGNSAFSLLIDYLRYQTNIWEYEHARAGAAEGLGYLGESRAIPYLTRARKKGGKIQEVDDAIDEALEKLGTKPSVTHDLLAKQFIASELSKEKPDFKGFAASIQRFAKAKRHGAWCMVAAALMEQGNEKKARKCYLEALANDPSHYSIAWGWLDLPPNAPRNAKTIEKLRQDIGSIVDD